MAKGGVNVAQQAADLISEIRRGVFRPVYLLMGEEPYYPDLICQAIIDNCLQEYEQDFNQTICYGGDVDSDMVISAARSFPMMADRQLVVLKEAQQMKDLEELSMYCSNPLDSTVFVVLMHRASADKRKAFYKSAVKSGVVVDSPALKDYEVVNWIFSYYRERSLKIEPAAAQLLAESAGTDIGTIVGETDKMLRNLKEGTDTVTVADVEKNVGISRQFSVFELTKLISMRDAPNALKVASHIGSAAKFAMPMATAAFFTHFYRILKYGALLATNPNPSPDQKAKVLGVAPFFFREYDAAVRAYPVPSAMKAISILSEYDFKSKGGGAVSDTGDEALFKEMVTKLLNV